MINKSCSSFRVPDFESENNLKNKKVYLVFKFRLIKDALSPFYILQKADHDVKYIFLSSRYFCLYDLHVTSFFYIKFDVACTDPKLLIFSYLSIYNEYQ